jgi:diphthamide biosynthesis methyltransferase
LDLDREINIFMKIKDALNLLLKKRIVRETSMIIAFSRAGGESEIFYDSVKGLLWRDIKDPAVIIIPGKLHFMEKEFLEMV